MSNPKKIYVLYPQVPLVVGGTERLADALCEKIRGRGHLADVVSIPFAWEPKEEIVKEMLAWRLINLDADMVIPLKFPAYCVRHHNKVLWLQHQYRQIYDFFGGPLSGYSNNLPDSGLRETVAGMETNCLSEARAIYTNSRNTAGRLAKFNGIDAEVLHIPPMIQDLLRTGEYGDYVFSVGRLEENKRFDLLLNALAVTQLPVRAIIAGTGSQETALKELAVSLGIDDRVEFVGRIDDVKLADLYANCRCVHFAPLDEDFGLITVEAMRSGKAVITAPDSGGPVELVNDGENGYIAEPDADAQAVVLDRIWNDRRLAESLGMEALKTAAGITWDTVLDSLLQWLD